MIKVLYIYFYTGGKKNLPDLKSENPEAKLSNSEIAEQFWGFQLVLTWQILKLRVINRIIYQNWKAKHF